MSTWTDYIYANGQKIARVASARPMLHMQGEHGNNSYGVEGAVSGVPDGVAGYTIQTGDRLSFSMFQTVPTYGGLALIFTTPDATGDTGSGGAVDTATGAPLYFNGSGAGQWQSLSGDLSAYAGRTISYVLGGIHSNTPIGSFDLYLADAAIQTADGRTLPILVGQGAAVGNFSPSNPTGHYLNSGTEMTPVTDAKVSTNYYLDDHLGTAQMELSGSGWPVWQGQFAPFGQELDSGLTAMHYKFTGKERDAESGLDYFGARYYASSMGRWMSPDWADKPEAVPYSSLDNPQSLNLYGYVNNNPLSKADPDGHCPECEVVIEEYGQPVEEAVGKYADKAIGFLSGVATAAWAKGSGFLDTAGDALASGLRGMPASTIDGIPLPSVQTMSNSPLAQPQGSPNASPAGQTGSPTGPDGPYKRPNNATSKEQRDSVQGKPCATCGATGQKNNADHKDPLIEQHYRGGVKPDKSPDAVRPQCSTCSAQQGGYLKQFSSAMKKLFGFN